jgi:magnesium-transporting ATPase (P-type)
LQDKEFNMRKYESFRDGMWVNVSSESIMAGDLVVIKENEVF